MGLSDRKQERTFVFTDGSSSDYTKWEGNEPNNKGGKEHCVHFWYRNPDTDVRKRWNDLPCEHKLAYVCELNPGLLVVDPIRVY